MQTDIPDDGMRDEGLLLLHHTHTIHIILVELQRKILLFGSCSSTRIYLLTIHRHINSKNCLWFFFHFGKLIKKNTIQRTNHNQFKIHTYVEKGAHSLKTKIKRNEKQREREKKIKNTKWQSFTTLYWAHWVRKSKYESGYKCQSKSQVNADQSWEIPRKIAHECNLFHLMWCTMIVRKHSITK